MSDKLTMFRSSALTMKEKKHVKTKAGIRLVPLHNELIKIGFLNYVKEMRKEKRLFPELRVNARGHYSDDISKWFGPLFPIQVA